MTFILSAQRRDPAHVSSAFERYQTYLAAVEDELPAGVRRILAEQWYFSLGDPRSPHDAWLESVTIAEVPSASDPDRRATEIVLRLLGSDHDHWLEYRYRDVMRYRLELSPQGEEGGRGHRDWRYDEFRLGTDGRVVHEIEWWGSRQTGTWLIEAADVEFGWAAREPVE